MLYRAQHHGEDEGVCIYLDGLSGHLHGSPATAEKDQRIRTWLRNNDYEVIEIAATDLHDAGAMASHFRKLAGYLREDFGRMAADCGLAHVRDINAFVSKVMVFDKPMRT